MHTTYMEYVHTYPHITGLLSNHLQAAAPPPPPAPFMLLFSFFVFNSPQSAFLPSLYAQVWGSPWHVLFLCCIWSENAFPPAGL